MMKKTKAFISVDVGGKVTHKSKTVDCIPNSELQAVLKKRYGREIR